MPFWNRSPKAATYPNLPRPPNALSPEAKKRAADLDITERRIADPVEANSNDKYIHGIDMWDFVTPGPSKEEQGLVARICAKCARKEGDETEIRNKFEADEEDAEEMVILRAGFSREEPATYRWFVAEYGTIEEVTSVSLLLVCDLYAVLYV